MRIKLAGIFVNDQDNARTFYSEVLGFQVHTDAAYGEKERWLTVVSPDDPEGTELALGLADGPRWSRQRCRTAGQTLSSRTAAETSSTFTRTSRSTTCVVGQIRRQRYSEASNRESQQHPTRTYEVANARRRQPL